MVSIYTRHIRIWITALALFGAGIACRADDVIGRGQNGGPTPTVALFSTATPGGRLSISLLVPTGGITPTITPGGPTLIPQSTVGLVIGPVGTATAAYGTLVSAAQTQTITPIGPLYQPGDCPRPAAPIPPVRPANFALYPQVIGAYLSQGGPTTILESTLREWGAVNEGGLVEADTDLTGKGFPDVIVTLNDPSYYLQGKLSPGQMLVYGCSQGGYQLLYSTPYTPQTMLPTLKRVGDMTGDAHAELVFTQQTCSVRGCTETMQILAWDASIGAFQPLNDTPINTTNGKVKIGYIDSDGALEVAVTFPPSADPKAGPTRQLIDVWDWDGTNYRLALIDADPPAYRIHALQDANMVFTSGDYKTALKMYIRVHDDPNLLPWNVPNESVMLPAYALLKQIYTLVWLKRSTDATFTQLQTENPPGSPGEGYLMIAQTFFDTYKQTRNHKKACDAALAIAASRPETLAALNSYGYANLTYPLQDLCPFSVK